MMNNGSWKYPSPSHWDLWMLYGKTNFVDVIVKDLAIGRFTWIILVGPQCNQKWPCWRETEGDLTTEKDDVTAEVYCCPAGSRRWERQTGSPLESPEVTGVLFYVPQFVVICYSRHRKPLDRALYLQCDQI